MEPFRVSNQLREVVGTYPDATLISDVAKNGGEAARSAIARQWLSEGIPFAFQNCPGTYESIRSWISTRLGVDPKEVNITGSAKLGQSLSPSKIGEPFNENSDLDLFIISNDLFRNLQNDFNAWSYDFESGSIEAKNKREYGFWKENLSRVPKNIGRGFIDSKLIPNVEKYTYAKNIAQTMYLLKEKLDVTSSAPKISHASIRCYKSWRNYVQQISLSLQ